MAKRRIFQILIALFVVALCSCESVERDQGTDACEVIGLKIVGGDACALGTTPQNSALVRVVVTDKRRKTVGLCSGTVIDSFTVLTAAHCFGSEMDKVHVETFVSSTEASRVIIHPSYGIYGMNAIYDVALVTFDSPLGVGSYPVLSSRQVSKGEEGVVAGFGQDRPPEEAIAGVIHAGMVEIDELSANHVLVSFEKPESHPCFGDSGGPLLVAISGEYTVAGVVSQADPEVDSERYCEKGDQTLFTNVNDPLIVSFISQYARGVRFR